jgi:hypothetical protein
MRFPTGIVFLISIFLFLLSIQAALARDIDSLPTKQNPLVFDSKNRRILIYTEVNEKGNQKISTHFGVVFKDGKLAEKALLRAYVSPLEFYDALIMMGMKPGNNLTDNSKGKYVEGDPLDVTVTWPGLNKEISLKDLLFDSGGKGFDIKFGGNRAASVVEDSGCITCLESCWVGITSNSSYPVVSTLTRFFNPNSRFSINGGSFLTCRRRSCDSDISYENGQAA